MHWCGADGGGLHWSGRNGGQPVHRRDGLVVVGVNDGCLDSRSDEHGAGGWRDRARVMTTAATTDQSEQRIRVSWPPRAETEAQANQVVRGCIRWAATGWLVQSIQWITIEPQQSGRFTAFKLESINSKSNWAWRPDRRVHFTFKFGSTAADADQVVVMNVLGVGQFKSAASLAQLQFLQEIHFTSNRSVR